jgi:hypothetical protein
MCVPARDTSGGDVKRIPRKTLLVSMTAALALSTGGIAWASAATEISATTGAVNSNVLPASGDPAAAQLFSQVTTLDGTTTTATPDKGAERVYLDYDNSIKFTANSKLAQCTASDATLAGGDTSAAATACGKNSVVGSGAATASLGNNTLPPFTVTAFNGPTSTAGGACTTPADGAGGPVGCQWEGGDPTIILFARSDLASQSVPVRGEIEPNGSTVGPAQQGGDVAYRLSVTDAPDVAGDVGAITLFNALVGKKYTNGKTGTKKKTYNYIAANCDDANKDLNYGATWVYDDNTTDTATWTQDCIVK